MLLNRDDLIKARAGYKKALDAQKKKILVCAGTGCVAGGALEIHAELIRLIEASGAVCQVSLEKEPHSGVVGVKKSGCHGFCEMGPLVRIEPQGWLYIKVQPQDCAQIIEESILGERLVERLAYKADDRIYPTQEEIPFYKKQTRLVLDHCGHIDATSIREYLAIGGYAALEKALFDMSADEIVKEIEESNLRGRGGGGYPAGRKWAQVSRQKSPVKYIVCNGDEGDPGAFMDRMLLESFPFRVLEGMLIAAYAMGIEVGILYIRAEYPHAVASIRKAIEIVKSEGLLGSMRLRIARGAGAFVCGEETALINSLEGHRGIPRVRPPYPAEAGLWGKPTCVNNVETFALIPWIVRNGADAFAAIGSKGSKGTKVFALAGAVRRGGLIEVPMGTTIRQIVEEIGGGVGEGRTFKAVLVGGPSGGCVPASMADTPVDYEALQSAGAIMGSGGMVVLDDRSCMVDLARFFIRFTQNESCGKCTMCRVGTRRMLEILDRICEGHGTADDLDRLETLAEAITQGSLCGLGQTAPNPVLSTLRHFRSEYEAHLEGRCPAGRCMKLIRYRVNDRCIGCTRCAQVCPVDAIEMRPHERHVIDDVKCVRCDVCRVDCPEEAIVVE